MSRHYSGPDFGFPYGDARLDLTDLYAFPKPGDAGKSILIMNVHPSASENPPGPITANDQRDGNRRIGRLDQTENELLPTRQVLVLPGISTGRALSVKLI
jgi:hypothetical protein